MDQSEQVAMIDNRQVSEALQAQQVNKMDKEKSTVEVTGGVCTDLD
jgi:hypothetical protein